MASSISARVRLSIYFSLRTRKWGGKGRKRRGEKGKEKRKRKGERKDSNFRIPIAEQ
jgi:hypothetical protein